MLSILISRSKKSIATFIKPQKYIISLVLVCLVLSQLPILQHIRFTEAADIISSDFHAFDASYPNVQDATNTPPGVRIRHGDAFGYFAEIKNLSDALPAQTPTMQIEMPALTAFDITTGSMTTYTDLECTYVIQTTGYQYNYQVDYTGLGSPCTINYISGMDITVSEPTAIAIGQSAYFRLTGMSTKSSYAFDPFSFAAKAYGQVVFGQGQVVSIQSNTFVNVGDITISGNIFYDNGTSGDADNGTKEAEENYVTTAGSVTAYISDSIRTYAGAIDASGHYSIIVPENNEVGAMTYFCSGIVPSSIDFRVTSTLASGIGAASGSSVPLADIGINNQTDLSITINNGAGPDPTVGIPVTHTIIVTNNGPTTAANIHVTIPSSGTGYTFNSATPGDGDTYTSGTGDWVIATLGSNQTASLSLSITYIIAGTIDLPAEIMSVTTPVDTYGSPDQDSIPGNGDITEDDQINLSLTIASAPEIIGYIFPDLNGNGMYDSGTENAGMSGVTVNLYDITGTETLLDATTTDSGGNYSFSGSLLQGNSYRITAVHPSGYALTTSNSTQDTIGVTAGSSNIMNPIGYFQLGSISGMVFIDLNDNDQRDIAENTGPENITVNLIDGSGSILGSQLTDNTGHYAFSNLLALTDSFYFVQFIPPTNYGFIGGHFGPIATDSDAIPSTGVTDGITILSNTNATDIDAGIYLLDADLAISKSVDTSTPYVDTDITYTITVHNNGPLVSTGSIVTDILPNEVSYSSHTASGGTFTPSNGQWTLPTITSGEEATLNITAHVLSSGTFRNTVDITHSEQHDGITSNNTDFVDVTSTPAPTSSPSPSPSPSTSASPTSSASPSASPSSSPTPSASPSSTPSSTPAPTLSPTPHLIITKSATPNQILPGGIVTYSITVTNDGTAAGNNIIVTDDVDNTSIGSDLIPRCVLSSRQITILDDGEFLADNQNAIRWNIGTLAPGHSQTVRLRAEIRNDLDSSANCRNTAVTGGSNIASTSQANAIVTVPVTTPSGTVLTFQKEAMNGRNNHVFNPGEHVQYRITLSNTGDQNSEALSIYDAGNSNYLKTNSVQSTGGIIGSITPLTITNILVSGGRSHTFNYDASITDAAHFPVRAFHIHKDASKTDPDFYPERIQKSRIRSNDSTTTTDILGAPDGHGVSLGTRGLIVLTTNRNGKVIVDGEGEDFCIATLNNQPTTRYRLSVSQSEDDSAFAELGTGNAKNNCFDLSDTDLSWARYIKIEDRSTASSNMIDLSVNVDAVCLLHVGGLIENTAELATSTQSLGSSTSTIVVDFTDALDSPLSTNDCREKKQPRIADVPTPPMPPLEVANIIQPVIIDTPIELPKTGTELAVPLIMSGCLIAVQWYRRRRKLTYFHP